MYLADDGRQLPVFPDREFSIPISLATSATCSGRIVVSSSLPLAGAGVPTGRSNLIWPASERMAVSASGLDALTWS